MSDHQDKKIIAVLGSHKMDPESEDYAAVRQVGAELARAGYVVCNGGYGGVMEASARGAREAGGETLGITIAGESRNVNDWIAEEVSVPTWEERLHALIDRSDGYVFCDGGTGTLTELMVAWEKTNQKLIQRPMVLFGSYMRALMQQLRDDRWIRWNDYLLFAETPEQVTALLKQS